MDSRQTLPRAWALPLLALAAAAAFLALAGGAEASSHCGATISPLSHSPSGSNVYTDRFVFDVVQTFSDAAAHCGVADWGWTIDGIDWNKLGTATLEGNNYVLRTQLVLDTKEGEYVVSPYVYEFCCGPSGQAAGSDVWSITIHWCDDVLAQTHAPTGDVATNPPGAIEITFTQDPLCPIQTGQLLLDGAPVATSGPQGTGAYTLRYVPPTPLLPGSHTVTASITQKCCSDTALAPKTQQASWTFNVLSCGESPYQPVSRSPVGTTSDVQPVIEATFRDLDRVCPVDASRASVRVDGEEVEGASVSQSGDLVTVTYVPALPLLPGPHSVTVHVEESCCTASGGRAAGNDAWSFVVLAAADEPFEVERETDPVSEGVATGPVVVDRQCTPPGVPPGVCVPQQTLPLPQSDVTVGVDAVRLSLRVDPTQRLEDQSLYVGDVHVLDYCTEGCPVPSVTYDPLEATVTYSVVVQGTTYASGSRTLP